MLRLRHGFGAASPNGVCPDSVRKAVAAFLSFADRAAHSRPAPEQHVPRRNGHDSWQVNTLL